MPVFVWVLINAILMKIDAKIMGCLFCMGAYKCNFNENRCQDHGLLILYGCLYPDFMVIQQYLLELVFELLLSVHNFGAACAISL